MISINRKKYLQISSKLSFKYGNKIIEYTLIKSRRRKTYDITIDHEGIILRAPFDKSQSDIENMLLHKIKWISSKQKEFNQRRLEIVKPTYRNNSTLPYLGANYELRVVYSNNIHLNTFEFKDNMFTAHIQQNSIEQIDTVKKLYLHWLNDMAVKKFQDKVEKNSKTVGVNPSGFVIKNLKNRWGSLSKDNSINLNVNLVKAPEEIIDYIIIHELCHIKIKGHSYQFWDYLKQFNPDYPRKVRWLEANSNNLI